MTTEQDKAYEAWWSDPAAPNNTRAIFVAGWEAHAAAPVVGSENSEIEFQKWWEHTPLPPLRHLIGECTAKEIWRAATAGRTAEQRSSEREAAELAGRAIEKQVWRAEIMGRAIEAFRDGRNETAQLLRNLANELFEKL